MTKREFITLSKNLFIALFSGFVLNGCRKPESRMHDLSQVAPAVASLLGYLLYEDNPIANAITEIETYLKTIVQNSIRKQLELELVYRYIRWKKNNSPFETLSPQDKKSYMNTIMPLLSRSSVMLETLQRYLQGDRALGYLDHPDLPGRHGECGWLFIEAEVWERYYPS